MPLPISCPQAIKKATEVRKSGEIAYLRPDGKTQVTVEYEEDTPVRVHTVLISAQHDPDTTNDQIRKDLIEKVIKTTIPADLLDDETLYYINPTGRFVVWDRARRYRINR